MSPNALRPFALPLVFALLAVLFGQLLGVAFGAAEDALKGGLKADAAAVLQTAYAGDEAKAKAVADKSFVYLKRAHMHAGALGTLALVLALVLAFLPGPERARQGAALAVSVGGLGYGVFWLFAGLAAPGLGGTGPAKEAYAWLAWPSSGLVVLGTAAALGLAAAAALRR